MIEVRNVSFGYTSESNVLENLNLHLTQGHIYGLLGLNGSGKTTLLKLLSGKLFASNGEVYVDNINTKDRNIQTLQNMFVMPSDFVFPKMSLEKYIALHSVFYPNFNKDVLNDCLSCFGIDKNTKDLNKLSLGESHKMAVSIALSFGTKIILLDEATNGMDIPARKTFRKMLMKHTNENQIIILSTHVVKDIENLLTDIIILKQDKTMYTSSLEDISRKYSFGIQSSEHGAIYAEPCAEGYHVICPKQDNTDTEISLELLFNALIKGGHTL